MSGSKTALKAIKTAIDGADFVTAVTKAEGLVAEDKQNYTGFLFLGFAHEKLNQDDAAEKAYQRAIAVKADDPQAYKGLVTVYEKQASKKLDSYHDTALRLGEIFAQKDDVTQCQNVVDKYELFAKKNGTRMQYVRALQLILPSSPLYQCLEGRVMAPFHTYSRIIEATESEEKEWINREIGERRTRLGAKIENVTLEVKCEAFARFSLDQLYAEAIDWTSDDEARRKYEECAFQRAYDTLVSLPKSAKPEKRDHVLNLANGMVIIKHPYLLAWTVALDWVDAESIGDWDVNIFWEFIEFFPDEGLSKVLRGFLDSDISPFPKQPPKSPEGDAIAETNEQTKEADRLILMVDGLSESHDSLLAHRILADYYLALEEFESAVETGRRAQQICQNITKSFAINLQDTLDAINTTLATALISHQSPRYHPEARSLFEEILTRKPTWTPALLGVGLVLEEDEDYEQAIGFLQKAMERDPSNIRVKEELAWCKAQANDLNGGLDELRQTLSLVEAVKPPNLGMKSEVLYRIGWCIWEMNPSKSARKSKEGAYRYFVDSVKANPEYAAAYTKLGIYFEEYSRNQKRSRTAFHKAFELSSSELDAAQRLARSFANNGEWDLVELVAQRVIDSGRARPAPGSKKKAHSWPFAALGIVQVNKQQYTKAIVSFQAALRITPDDYHSWVGLGESYHNSGRYIAATKTFQKAESLEKQLPAEDTWFAKYMLSNVCRERGMYEEAIERYETVLTMKPGEFGVSIALIQTLAESAWANVERGVFGEAAAKATRVIAVATDVAPSAGEVFNLWKTVGDACAVFSAAQSYVSELDCGKLLALLKTYGSQQELDTYANIDKVDIAEFESMLNESETSVEKSDICALATILAPKRAVSATLNDRHAQAVAWYNLGWAEHTVHVTASSKLLHRSKKGSKRFQKTAVLCFKRAIELEAGNSEFWNALGVATMTMNPKISQHAFVRSLHLNQRSATVWTNLGALYLIHEDKELANEAFTLAQSIDPDYAHAWVGQGLLALQYNQKAEADGLFTHAFGIASTSNLLIKKQYVLSVFDSLITSIRKGSADTEITDLLAPYFALQKINSQAPHPSASTTPYKHLLAQFAERLSSFDDAISTLTTLTRELESSFEKDESPQTLIRYACSISDLARSQLSSHSYEEAIESASTALDLSASAREDSSSSVHTTEIHKIRLSSHLTLGLSHFFLLSSDSSHISSSIDAFYGALAESNPTESPDIVCALAQVLWAKGGEKEKEVAREQLFSTVEGNPTHVGAVCLLGAIAVLDNDSDALEAVQGDLESFRINSSISESDRRKVSNLLSAVNEITALSSDSSVPKDLLQTSNAATTIMLNPANPEGYSELATAATESNNIVEAKFNAQMAKLTALKASVETGNTSVSAEGLAEVMAGTGSRKDALLGIMINPAGVKGWESLGEAIKT